jgi:hypothetical protein
MPTAFCVLNDLLQSKCPTERAVISWCSRTSNFDMVFTSQICVST